MSRLEWITAMHAGQYQTLWRRLGGVTEHELDWHVHPEANTIRWVLAHLLFTEQWTVDMLHRRGRYLNNVFPESYGHQSVEDIRTAFDQATHDTHAALATLREDDLERRVDLIRSPRMTTHHATTLAVVLDNHVTHLAGHLYQVRLIRGTYAREHGTDKALFDPW